MLSAHGGTAAFASPVLWENGIDESWVGLHRAGEPSITLLADPPLGEPFSNPAIQVTDRSVLLLGTLCPEPDAEAADEGASCGRGKAFALSYDLVGEKWSTFTPPPLPEGQRLSLGLINGAPTFGVLTTTGPGGTNELVAYTQNPDGSRWDELPPPPLADIAAACATSSGLVAVETSVVNAAVMAGNKSFDELEAEKRQLETIDDGNMYAALYDPNTRTWAKSKVTANRTVSHVECQEPGIVYTRANTKLVVQPAAGPPTTFTATAEIGPNPSAVEVNGSLVATYWYDISRPRVEQATATDGKAAAPVQLRDTAYPATSFSLSGHGYWAGIEDHQIKLYPVASN